MRKELIIAFPTVISLFMGSCEKELDFKYNDIEPILVIEGSLTKEGGEVSLTYTTPMDEAIDRARLTDAAVTITDLDTGDETELFADADGKYVTGKGGREGHTYRLTVVRGGETYFSDCVMESGLDLTGMEFSWIKMPYDYVAVLQVTFTDDTSSSDNYYWVRLYRNGEAYKWSEVNDVQSSEGLIRTVFMTTRRNLEEEDDGDKLEEGDVVKATVVPVSRGMYDYLGALSVGNSNGPLMFRGGFCLGYFLAAPMSEGEITFHPDQF